MRSFSCQSSHANDNNCAPEVHRGNPDDLVYQFLANRLKDDQFKSQQAEAEEKREEQDSFLINEES